MAAIKDLVQEVTNDPTLQKTLKENLGQPTMEAKQPIAKLRQGDEEHLLFAGQAARIGRAGDSDIVLNDPKVSRNHAVLEWEDGGFVLRDLGSINGTSVNGQRLAADPLLLRDGDQIMLSKQVYVYEIIRAAPAEPPAAVKRTPGTDPLTARGPFLTVSAGPDMGQDYPLWGESITIGRASRDATWEIRLTDRAISRPHARIERTGAGFFLTDLNSVNGTKVNGKIVTDPVTLQEGDEIGLGETRLTFHP